MLLFDTKLEANIFYVIFKRNLEDSAINILKGEVKNWSSQNAEIFVLDFKMSGGISHSVYSIFVQLTKEIRANKKILCSVGLKPEIKKQLKNDGLETIFNPQDDLKKITGTASTRPQAKLKIDVEFLNPFIKAVNQTFTVQANTKITPDKPFIKTKEHVPNIAIAGIINITSKVFRGTLSLCFSKDVFLKIYENMLGETHKEITPEISDCCGELLNIIFGAAKADLNNKSGYEIEKAIPTVLTGEKVRVSQTTSEKIVVLPFKIEVGVFFLEITAEVD